MIKDTNTFLITKDNPDGEPSKPTQRDTPDFPVSQPAPHIREPTETSLVLRYLELKNQRNHPVTFIR